MPVTDARLAAVVADLLNGALDPAAPGRGLTDYPTDVPADIPKAYAMVVKAAALDGGRTPALAELGRISGDWLLAHDDEDGDGVIGWGLPFAWDAFGDGTPNPENTEYAITTAIVVDALLDRANTLSGTPREAILELAWQALSPYLAPGVATPGGLAPYSLTVQDRSWDVSNTAAYLGGIAQRLSSAEVSSERAAALRAFADTQMQALLDSRLVAASGAWYWPYMLPGTTPNDLPHASYVAYSIEAYAREGGRLADMFPRDLIFRYVGDIVNSAEGYVRSFPDFSGIDAVARSYDVGFALATLSLNGNPLPDVREQLVDAMSTYRLDDGHYAKHPVTGPGVRSGAPLAVNEYETYFLFGATAALADVQAIAYVQGEDVALSGGAGDDTLIGNAGSNHLTGLGGTDTLIGNAGNDILDGGPGSDRMEGGDGVDWFFVDSSGDVVIEGAGGGSADRAYASVSYGLGAGVEIEIMKTRFDEGTAAIDLTGNELANFIVGNDGDNELNGLGGTDTMRGALGNDWYFVDDVADIVVEAAGGGSADRVYASVSYALGPGVEIEIMKTRFDEGAAAINLTGNELANFIVGNDGNNQLDGLGGADTMRGALGNDWYFVDNAADVVIETAGEGSADRVFASASYTLGAGVEAEMLTTTNHDGTTAIDLTGNELANFIAGNEGNNVLNGLAGNDVLRGGAGADRFVIDTTLSGATNVDQITDFALPDDVLHLDDVVFAGLALGALPAGSFVVGAAAQDANDRIIYNASSGAVFFDPDGTNAIAAIQFATLSANLAVTIDHFVVV